MTNSTRLIRRLLNGKKLTNNYNRKGLIMKIENLEQATGLANKIRNLDLLLSGKQANCWFSVTNRDGDVYTFN